MAMLVFYQADVLDEPLRERARALFGEGQTGAEARAFIERLIELYERHQAAIDRALREAGASWELERMAATDRAILRVATTELLLVPEIPAPVSLNEAIEIAKDYGGDEAGRFVNGVLDAVHRRRQSAAADDTEETEDDTVTDDPAGGACDTH
jgi:N utilization substance protein B